MPLHYDRGTFCKVQVCYAVMRLHTALKRGNHTYASGQKGHIYIYRKCKSPFKEWLCPSGLVGLERNDSQCRPPETNCHWPPWIFQGTLDWKWTIQFPTGSLAISPLCIIEKAATFGFWSVGHKYSQNAVSKVQELSASNYGLIHNITFFVQVNH